MPMTRIGLDQDGSCPFRNLGVLLITVKIILAGAVSQPRQVESPIDLLLLLQAGGRATESGCAAENANGRKHAAGEKPKGL
jgi:hypothetical protein